MKPWEKYQQAKKASNNEDWDPFKDEGATPIEDAPEWDPFRDEGASEVEPKPWERYQKNNPAAVIDTEIADSIKRQGGLEYVEPEKVAIADWLERQHGVKFDEGIRVYESHAKAFGLSGNVSADYEDLKQRRELSQQASKRLPRLSARIGQAKNRLGGSVTASGVFVSDDEPDTSRAESGGTSRREGMRASGPPPLDAPMPEEEKAKVKEAFRLLESDARADELRRIAKESRTSKGFWETVKENAGDLIPVPVAGMMDEIQEATNLLDLVNRYDSGEASNSDELELYRMLADQQRERTIGGNVGEILTMMPQFMTDIAAGSGLYSLGSQGTKKGLQRALKKKTFDQLEKRLIGKGLLAAPGMLTGTAASLPVAGGGMAVEQYQQAMIPELEVRGESLEDFKLLVGDSPKASDAAKEALASTYIELFSERTGGAIAGLGEAVAGRFIKSGLGRYLMRYNEKLSTGQMKSIVDQVGWNGVLGEMFEERFSDAARFAAGLDEELHIPDVNQLAAELIAFSVPAGAFYATERFRAIDKFVAPENGVTASVWNGLDQNFSDVEVLYYGVERFDDPQLAGDMVKAKHGDTEAQGRYNESASIDPGKDPLSDAGLTAEELDALGQIEAREGSPEGEAGGEAVREKPEETPTETESLSLVDEAMRRVEVAEADLAHVRKEIEDSADVPQELRKSDAELKETETKARRALTLAKKNVEFARIKESAMRKLDREVKKRTEAIRKKAEDRENLVDAIGALESLVAQLPLPIRGKFKGFRSLAKRKTEAGRRAYLNVSLKRLESIMDDFNRRDMRRRVVSRADKLQKQIREAKAGRKKLPYESAKIEDYLARIRKNPSAESLRGRLIEIEKRLKQSDANAEQGRDEDPALLGRELEELLEQVSRWSIDDPSIPASELRRIENDIELLVSEGRTVREAKNERRRAEIQLAAMRIYRELGEGEQGTIEHRRAKAVQAMRDFGVSLLRPEQITELLTGKRASALKGSVFEPLFQAEQVKYEGLEDLREMLREIIGGLDVRAAESKRNVLIEIKGVPFSLDEAMAVYAYSQNERGRLHLQATSKSNKKTGAVVQLDASARAEILAALPDSAKQSVDRMIDYFDNEQYYRVSEVFEQETGTALPKEGRYFPVRNLNRSSSYTDLLADYLDAGIMISKGFTKARIDSSKGFASLSFFETAVKGAVAAEHYIAYSDALRRVDSILNFEDRDAGVSLSDRLRRNSKELTGELQVWVRDVANGRIRQGQKGFDRFINWLRRNSVVALLGMNIGTMMKQPGSFFPALKRGDAASILHQSMRFANPVEALKMVEFSRERSPFLRSRAQNLNTELAERAQEGQTKALLGAESHYRKFQELALMPMQVIDGITATVVWSGQYRSVYNSTGDEAAAIRAADELVRQTQSTGDLVNSARLYRSGGMEKALIAFTTDINQMFNNMLSDGRTESGLHKRAASIALYYVMPAIWMALATLTRDELYQLFGLDDEEEVDLEGFKVDLASEFVGQVLGPVPFLAAPAQGITYSAMGEKGQAYFRGKNNLAAFAGLDDIGTGTVEGAVYGTGIVLGFPGVPTVKKLIEKLIED